MRGSQICTVRPAVDAQPLQVAFGDQLLDKLHRAAFRQDARQLLKRNAFFFAADERFGGALGVRSIARRAEGAQNGRDEYNRAKRGKTAAPKFFCAQRETVARTVAAKNAAQVIATGSSMRGRAAPLFVR